MSAIFISYRREDAEGQAGRLFQALSEHFGKDSVFMDVTGIQPGRDFRKVIDSNVASCGALLAVIGKGWLDAKDENGKRRIEDPQDFVRLETISALKRDIPVIPVLVRGAAMPRAEQLPSEMEELAFRNGVELTHARWDSDVIVLIKALEQVVGTSQAGQAAGSAANTATQNDPKPTQPTAGGLAQGLMAQPVAAAPAPQATSGFPIKIAAMAIGAAALLWGGVTSYQSYTEKAAAEAFAEEKKIEAEREAEARRKAEVARAEAEKQAAIAKEEAQRRIDADKLARDQMERREAEIRVREDEVKKQLATQGQVLAESKAAAALAARTAQAREADLQALAAKTRQEADALNAARLGQERARALAAQTTQVAKSDATKYPGANTVSPATQAAAANSATTQPRAPTGLKSGGGSVMAKITFTNVGKRELEVYWIGYDGVEKLYYTLAPGTSYDQRTYVSNAWVVRDSQTKRQVATTIATPEDKTLRASASGP
jgi:TIR domain/VHL beta domain